MNFEIKFFQRSRPQRDTGVQRRQSSIKKATQRQPFENVIKEAY